mmetsp:Transcript_105550/g.251514  ORF Transcript_105550/g.251514 Transcript_105550/m.251514 type:complete len:213 (+) Transcript_105550:1005-1643(+)
MAHLEVRANGPLVPQGQLHGGVACWPRRIPEVNLALGHLLVGGLCREGVGILHLAHHSFHIHQSLRSHAQHFAEGPEVVANARKAAILLRDFNQRVLLESQHIVPAVIALVGTLHLAFLESVHLAGLQQGVVLVHGAAEEGGGDLPRAVRKVHLEKLPLPTAVVELADVALRDHPCLHFPAALEVRIEVSDRCDARSRRITCPKALLWSTCL